MDDVYAKTRLSVTNLPKPTKQPSDTILYDILLELFSQIGPVKEIKIYKSPSGDQRLAFIDFTYEDTIEYCLKVMKNVKLFGERICFERKERAHTGIIDNVYTDDFIDHKDKIQNNLSKNTIRKKSRSITPDTPTEDVSKNGRITIKDAFVSDESEGVTATLSDDDIAEINQLKNNNNQNMYKNEMKTTPSNNNAHSKNNITNNMPTSNIQKLAESPAKHNKTPLFKIRNKINQQQGHNNTHRDNNFQQFQGNDGNFYRPNNINQRNNYRQGPPSNPPRNYTPNQPFRQNYQNQRFPSSPSPNQNQRNQRFQSPRGTPRNNNVNYQGGWKPL